MNIREAKYINKKLDDVYFNPPQDNYDGQADDLTDFLCELKVMCEIKLEIE